jgi:hypothetical protein
MKNSIISILGDNIIAIYIYGSVAMDDFKLGWSDIDILCITDKLVTDEQANKLLILRQTLLENEKDNLYFRSFEGAIVSLQEYVNQQYTKVVYWGTSGQRITDDYYFDAFSQCELISDGILIYGRDIKSNLQMPSFIQLKEEVKKHYNTIRKYAVKLDGSLYSCGWFLDIARGIYTLRTGKVIAKTRAGEWAIENHICPSEDIMSKVLEVRYNPNLYKNKPSYKEWVSALGEDIQKFADVLENEINYSIRISNN